MIDFKNGEYLKLRKVSEDHISKKLKAILLDDETVIGLYKGVRDYVAFTDKRVIAVNVQGLTGKSQDFTSLPYKKISVFSVETAGVFDLDGELEMYFSGVGKVRFEFTGASDILTIGKMISKYAL